jgi:hypothetical protein
VWVHACACGKDVSSLKKEKTPAALDYSCSDFNILYLLFFRTNILYLLVVVDGFMLLQVNNAGITGTMWSVGDPEIFRQKVS